ncbi:hypothetical protein D1BOALGB6SA_83 [Olavius sp. associated proteobacterium Delta 1]|nr:hypothetical protein D1BOALGB6SA_83 [Olavius sp. associated proteobacterium Delta 1]
MNVSQAKTELRIFRSFAEVCELPIDVMTIEKREPPEPDILCKINDGGTITFELTELIDRGFANMIGKQNDTKTRLDNYYFDLPMDMKKDFDSLYSDAIIFINFNNSISMRQREMLFSNIFNNLLGLESGSEGNFLKDDPQYRGKFRWITISRGVNGPIFDTVPAMSIGDSTTSVIESKINKNYLTEYPLHLLAYIDLNPMLPDHIWLPKIEKFLANNLKNSDFEKAWIFDFHKKEIRCSFPC